MDREWIANDYYADLGVTRAASSDEIAERYRELAKDLHPDRNPGDVDAEAAFKRIARAYAVLGNAERRRRYDAARDAVFDRGFAPTVGTTRPTSAATAPPRAFRLSPRVALACGIGLLVLGLAACGWIVAVTRRDNALEARGVAATAKVVAVRPEARVRFRTDRGEVITTRAPLVRNRRNGGYQLDEAVPIRYDRDRPSRIIVNESRVARDVTMWIVAVKLLVCGAILLGFACRRPRRRQESSPIPPGRPAISA